MSFVQFAKLLQGSRPADASHRDSAREARGLVPEAPLRAELLSVEQLRRFARELARRHVTDFGPAPNRLLNRLSENAAALRASHQVLVEALGKGRRLSPPGEWLLDNFYLIEQHIHLARLHLPRTYSRKLPRLTQGPMQGLPRVYGMAFELIAHSDGLLDMEATSAFVAAYQSVAPLCLGELWAFPIALRLGLIENLRRVAVRIAAHRREKDDGLEWAERTLATVEKGPKELIRLLADFADARPTLTAPFLEEFVGRLQGHGTQVAFILNWVEQSLAEQATTVAQMLHADSHEQAAEHISIANSIGSLRFLSAEDWKAFVESLSHVEHILARDPAGVHAAQDFATRDRYRHTIERLARRARRPETEIAQAALEAAARAPGEDDGTDRGRHIGAYLVGRARHRFERDVGCRWSLSRALARLLGGCRLALYLAAIAVTALLLAATLPALLGLCPLGLRFWLWVALAVVPASSLALSLINYVATLWVPPHPLPRLDFSAGIPEGHRTMVVVPTLLPTDLREIAAMVEGLEIRYLGNRDPQLHFALLTDFADADQERLPEDETWIAAVREAVERLNQRHPRGDGQTTFHWLHRPRRWNPHEQRWMGYERKRGKLEQFNDLLRGEASEAFSEQVGEAGVFGSIRYVITLDTDTDLPRGAAHRMVGALAHPLNRPRIDPRRGRVVEGYTILQPRASVRLEAVHRSLFSRLSGGVAGLDPYSQEVSDVYQDLFAEGSYVGKGIYDVDAFRATLQGRFPDNVILSHDLLESGYARSALLSCVEVYEDAPHSYLGEISRQHRWMRGDWQIARWLGPRPPAGTRARGRNPLGLLTRWKMLDNLRRSAVAPLLLVLLVCAWLSGPAASLLGLGFVFAVLCLTDILRSLTVLVRKPRERGWRLHLRTWALELLRHAAKPLLSVTMLPYESVITLDAFRHSALRLPFTRKGLLIWHLPQYARRNARTTAWGFVREMWSAPALALGAVMALAGLRPEALPLAVPVLLLWFLAPLVAWSISRARPRREPVFSASQKRTLGMLSRRTWHFFDTFVTADEHWLAPDNFQEVPEPVVAPRTSPTNLGFGLLANLSAWDFGYLSTDALLEHTARTLDTMERLERYRGQFYNWYNTRTLEPLAPRYISSVDSGNLAASLLTLRVGLGELREQPALSPRVWQGVLDTLAVLDEEVGGEASEEYLDALREVELCLVGRPSDAAESLRHLRGLGLAVDTLVRIAAAESSPCVASWTNALRRQCADLTDSANRLLADVQGPVPILGTLARGEAEDPANASRKPVAAALLQRAEALAERCHALESAMDFRFLYHLRRDLLSIGFDVEARRLDPGCYDLLASEARIASFLLVAGEQAPTDHWFALGRLLTGSDQSAALVSWSGSMFEYLMPALFMQHYDGTLLQQTCTNVVQRQIRYGRQRQVPWGISESCYNATDARHTYQYRAFGVPGLGLKRGLSDDLVIAPYATLMALPWAPREACENLERLMTREGALGAYGLVEAIDYTPSRVPRGKSRAVVRAYMSHHQGMGFLSLSQVLLGGPMVRRFMAEPSVRATSVLLQERVPDVSPVVRPHEVEAATSAADATVEPGVPMRVFQNPLSVAPEVHLLSNGNYHAMVTHVGGGYSRWCDLLLTRWREDVTRDGWGAFLYLRDVDAGAFWSNTFQPTARPAEHYEAIFTQGRAEFRRRDLGIETHTEICISPEDDVEIRRITLTNRSRDARRLEVTSYAEVVLAPAAADLAHRVFSNLFVQTEHLDECGALLCTRRKRSESDPELWLFHLVANPEQARLRTSFETDRARFVGRNRTLANPLALDLPAGAFAPLSNTAGCVLDPVVAVRAPVELDTEQPVRLHVITGVAPTREEALALIDKYRDRHFVERAFDMAWSHSQIVMRQLGVSETETQLYGRLAGAMLYTHARRRAAPEVLARNRLGPQGLWRFGISGDLPILLLRIGNLRRLELVTETLRAHAYWRLKGLLTDLVIINEDYSGYRATLNDSILGAINAGPDAGLLDRPGGVFVRRIETLSEEDLVLFQTTARVVLSDTAETLREQVERRYVSRRLPPLLEPVSAPLDEPPLPLPARELILRNDRGGFTPDGREYVILLEPGATTPAPWSNVIASPHIGTVVTESGSMYTWTDNAHEFRLTPWSNDPVADPSGEALYLRDDETGVFWSLTPSPAPGRSGYVCRHGFGYSVFDHDEAGVLSETWVYVAMDAPVKFLVAKLRNRSGRSRRLSLAACFELVLGEWRHACGPHIVTSIDPRSGALFARNPYSREYRDRVCFATCSEKTLTVSGSRTEFLGRNGSYAAPDALRRVRLSGRTGAGFDPAAALHAEFTLADGEEREVVLTLGSAPNEEAAQDLVRRLARPAGAHEALEQVWEHWNRLLGAVYVETDEEPALTVLTNGWLLYQTLSSRIWGRSGFYQSGGAYGFRDQLQDAMALLHVAPDRLRDHLLLCASRQFAEGDVQHWWHPPGGAGVRTHFSDDLLWLPYATAQYVLAIGDTGVLDEQAPFLEGRPLAPDEESQYEQHVHAGPSAPLYEHCVRAIRRSLRFGAHGLPLIGCGDWNDGMNRIGREGRGESVWLAWFLYDTLQRFAQVADLHNDAAFAETCRHEAEELRGRAESAGWDGAWYRRAYYDDGTPLGSAENDECRIDSLSQSWAVLSGAARPDRARQAMEAVREHLVREQDGLLLLFAPPFDQTPKDPGYIKGYPPGVRENGGQYTHGAVWTVMAFAQMGEWDVAWRLLRLINPVHHGDSAEAIARYRVEPYVMTADLYGAPPHVGRGGWSWYTGAAGWTYRLVLETLLGVERRPDHLRVRPRLPADSWKHFRIHYRYRENFYHIEVSRAPAGRPGRVTLDGKPCADGRIPLRDDRQDHQVVVVVGREG